MIPDVVNAYNLDWWELEPFLKKIYPGVSFKENVSVRGLILTRAIDMTAQNANRCCCSS